MSKNLKFTFFVMFLLTLITKAMGFLREALLAKSFGTSIFADIYVFSDTFTTLVSLGIGTTISTIVIPMLVNYINHETVKKRIKLVNNIINITFLLTTGIAVILFFSAPYIIKLLSPEFNNNKNIFFLSVKVFRMLLITISFVCLQSVLVGVLQAHKKFFLPTSISIFFNGVFIGYFLFFIDKFGLIGLALANIIAYLLQLGMCLPKTIKLGYRYKFELNFKDENIRKIIKLGLPVFLGTSIDQINTFINRVLASYADKGAISVLNYSSKICMLIYGLITGIITTVYYTNFSYLYSREENEKFANSLFDIINKTLIVLLPLTIGLILLRREITSIVFERGAFDQNSVASTSAVLLVYAPAIVFWSIKNIINSAFYAMKDSKTPVINSSIGVICNIVLNIILVHRFKAAGLAFGTTFSAFLTACLLFSSILKRVEQLHSIDRKFIIETFKIGISGVIMFIFQSMTMGFFKFYFKSIYSYSLFMMIYGTVLYIICLSVFRSKIFFQTLHLVFKRLKVNSN